VSAKVVAPHVNLMYWPIAHRREAMGIRSKRLAHVVIPFDHGFVLESCLGDAERQAAGAGE
jgi:hypothetical protein